MNTLPDRPDRPDRPGPIARFSTPCRVWAVAAVRGEADKLKALHAALAPRLAAGDRLVYLGSVIGRGAAVRETVDEMLRFRRDFLARPGNCVGDYAVLRGRQEEMWHKLLELQFAVDPRGVLTWMAGQGVEAVIAAYGGSLHDGQIAAGQGAVALTKWTSSLRAGMAAAPGHRELLGSLKHAAYTADGAFVFVHAALEPDRPLDAQGDAPWWNAGAFEAMTAPFFDAERVVRGLDPARRGVVETPYTLSLDGGCGFGGPLIAAGLRPGGDTEIVQV